MSDYIIQDRNATRYFKTIGQALANTSIVDGNNAELSLDEGGNRVAQMLVDLLKNKKKAMAIGNGGSAAMASHTHNDLSKMLGIQSLVFTEVPMLTALSNDNGYSVAFEQQVDLWAQPGDLLIAVSSSGRSENILRAVQSAKNRGCNLITLTGFNPDNPLRRMGDVNFYVSGEEYGIVESAHAVILHFMTDRAVFLKNSQRG